MLYSLLDYHDGKEKIMPLIFAFIISCLPLFSQTINAQIHALEKASPTERVVLMNHIKRQLVHMNQNKRKRTLDLLKHKLHSKNTQMLSNTNHQYRKAQQDSQHNMSSIHRNMTMQSFHHNSINQRGKK